MYPEGPDSYLAFATSKHKNLRKRNNILYKKSI